MSEYSVLQLANFIENLPADKEAPPGTQGYNLYNTQKAHWLGWLDSKSKTGSYQRQDKPGRDAKYIYNHIMEPKMLLWLISSVVTDSDLVVLAKAEAKSQKSMASSCAAIRKVVTWQILEKNILNTSHGQNNYKLRIRLGTQEEATAINRGGVTFSQFNKKKSK